MLCYALVGIGGGGGGGGGKRLGPVVAHSVSVGVACRRVLPDVGYFQGFFFALLSVVLLGVVAGIRAMAALSGSPGHRSGLSFEGGAGRT